MDQATQRMVEDRAVSRRGRRVESGKSLLTWGAAATARRPGPWQLTALFVLASLGQPLVLSAESDRHGAAEEIGAASEPAPPGLQGANGRAAAGDGSPQPGEAPEATGLDLTVEDVIVLALRNSRTLTNARLSRSVERFALRVAENEFRPRLTLGGYAERDVGDVVLEPSGILSALRLRIPTGGELAIESRVADPGTGQPDLDPHTSVIDLTFTQPLLRGAGFTVGRASLRTARTAEEINVLALRSLVIDVTTRAIRAYRAYVQAGRRNEISQKSLERTSELLGINRMLVETGRMAERDVIQTEADLARRELDVVASLGGVDAARLALIDVLDIDTRTQIGRTDALRPDQVGQLSADPEAGIETAFVKRPDYQGALLALRNAETRAAVARNERWWDLSLTLGTSFAGTGRDYRDALRDLERPGHRVGLDLSIPVGPAATGYAELEYRRATATVAVSRNNLEDLRQRIAIQVRNAMRDVQLERQRVELGRRARELALRKAEIEREKLSLGLSTNFQLVTFDNDLVVAQIAELDAVVAYLNAVTELDRALGTTLDRWNIDIDRVEHSIGDAERFGLGGGR